MKKQPEVRIQSKTDPSIGKKIGDVYKRRLSELSAFQRTPKISNKVMLSVTCALFGQRKQPSI